MKKLFVVQKLVEEMNEKAWSDTKLFISREKAMAQLEEWKKEIQNNVFLGFESNEKEDEFSYELEIYGESNYSVIVFEQEIEDEEPEKEPEVKIERIMETTYENDTCWIEYKVGENELGYEITSDLQEGDENILQSWIDNEKFSTSNMVNKKKITECSEKLAEIIEECRQSENEMWFVEYEDMSDRMIEKLSEEVNKIDLDEYIRFHEDDCAITVYGGVITQFLF